MTDSIRLYRDEPKKMLVHTVIDGVMSAPEVFDDFDPANTRAHQLLAQLRVTQASSDSCVLVVITWFSRITHDYCSAVVQKTAVASVRELFAVQEATA